METNDTFEKRYGFIIRKATEEEKSQEHTCVGFGSHDVQDNWSRHKQHRLTRGLAASIKEGV
jgi:hypothetical protein